MDYIDKIRELRIERGETQESMAKLLQTTRQQYSKYENKVQELPIRHLITICAYFAVTSDFFLGNAIAMGAVGAMPFGMLPTEKKTKKKKTEK